MTQGGYPDGAAQPPYEPPQRCAPPQYGQPPYPAPQYGPPQQYPTLQYGQPQYGPTQPYPPYGRQPDRRTFGVTGTLIAAIGAALVLVAFVGPNWLDSSHSTFHDIRRVIDDSGALRVTTTAHDYFNWLGWTLLGLCTLLAVLANAPTGIDRALRSIGGLIGLLAATYTLGSIKLSYAAHYSQYSKHAGPGFYMAIAGFLLLSVGAVIGPRRHRA